MAWDMGFNIQWTQRIEKEERAFINGARIREEIERKEEKEARKQRRSRRTGGWMECRRDALKFIQMWAI
eukprot:g32536.t1